MRANSRRCWIPARSWFLFNTWFSLLVICVSAGTTLHVSIGRTAWPVIGFCTGLVIFLAIKSRHTLGSGVFRWPPIVASALILGAAGVVLWGSLVKGEFVSVYPDAWSYTAFGTYLRNPVPAVGTGLDPIVSFGRHLMNARYGTAGLLALFAEISGTDSCRSAGIYAVLILIHTGLGFALLARVVGAGRILAICAGMFGVSIGWAPEILKIGNWDQGLFLSFIPFVLVRVRLSTFQTSRMSGTLALGLNLAALAFAYPEGAAISGVLYGPLIVWRLLRGNDLRGKLRKWATTVTVALLLSGVYLPKLIVFLHRQIHSGTTSFNAKGVLPGLLSTRWLPSVYGLGEQPPIAGFKTNEWIVPVLFVGLSFLALKTWWRKKDGILLTVPAFLVLTLWQAVLLKYDYGFYKVLTMFWPVMGIAIFVGVSRMLAQSPSASVRMLVTVAFSGVMAAAVFVERGNFQYAPWRAEREIGPFLELVRLKEISGNAPICIVTQSWFNQMWAVFFLQGYKLLVASPLGYLQHRSSGLHGVTTEQVEGAVLLTDEKRSGDIWHNEIFSLQSHLNAVELFGIDAPNRVETVQGDSFVWLDNQFASLTIHSDANRQALFNIKECWTGPSRPGDKYRTLIMEVNGMQAEFPALSNMKVPLKLKRGYNLVRLSCKETPTAALSSDPRTLLLGIKGFSLATRAESVEVTAIDAPNRVETVQGDPFIWLNNQFTNVTIDSDADRACLLKIRECWPGPSRPEETKRTLIVEANGTDVEVPASSNLEVPLSLKQGSNLVRLSCKETPTVDKLSSGDVRTLLLGIKGLSVTAD